MKVMELKGLCLASLRGLHRCLCPFPETLRLLLWAAGMASVELEDPQNSSPICFWCLHLLPIFFLGLLFWELSPRQALLQGTCPGVCIFTLSSGLQPGEELAEPSWLQCSRLNLVWPLPLPSKPCSPPSCCCSVPRQLPQ